MADDRKKVPPPKDSGITDVVLQDGHKSPKPGRVPLPARLSAFDQVADSDDFEEDTEDPTPITSANSQEQMILKIGIMVERQSVHVKQIPGIATKVTEVATKQTAMEERQTRMDGRLDVIEKNGHPCTNQHVIDGLLKVAESTTTDVQEGIKTREMVKGIRTDVNENKGEIGKVKEEVKTVDQKNENSQKRSLVYIIGGVIGLIATVAGATYCIGSSLGGVRGDLRTEHTLRDEQYKTVKNRLDKLPTTEQVPSKQQITDLGEALENGDEFEERCNKLTPQQKTRLARQVRSGSLPVEFLCP